MNLLLKTAVRPVNGANSAVYSSNYSDRDGWLALTSPRSSFLAIPLSLGFHKLMNKVRFEENSITIQNIHGCVACLNKIDTKRGFSGYDSHFGSQLHLKTTHKGDDCWHTLALNGGANFRACQSSIGCKVADKSSTSTTGFSTFDSVFQALQEFVRQSHWIALLQPLHLVVKNSKPEDSSEEPILVSEDKAISKISSFLSSIFKAEVASDAGEATALNLEYILSSEKLHCHQATLSNRADKFHFSLLPVSEISNAAVHDVIAPSSFISGTQHYNPCTTLVEQGKVSQMIPQAELCESNARHVTAEQLGSVEALADWLAERLKADSLQVSCWGKAPGTKSLSNLWCELVEGEISLEDSYPPKRTVHVASVHIQNESGNCLVEAYQEMSDGRIRQRNRPLSEKMRLGENIKDACLRGIYEELGTLGAPERVSVLQDSYQRKEEERESNSYPGLLTRYIIHTMSVHIRQLPPTEFSTFEDENHQLPSYNRPVCLSSWNGSSTSDAPVGVKRHFWKWI